MEVFSKLTSLFQQALETVSKEEGVRARCARKKIHFCPRLYHGLLAVRHVKRSAVLYFLNSVFKVSIVVDILYLHSLMYYTVIYLLMNVSDFSVTRINR